MEKIIVNIIIATLLGMSVNLTTGNFLASVLVVLSLHLYLAYYKRGEK